MAYRECPLALFFRANNELLLAHVFAYGNGVETIFKARQLVGPLGSLLGFDEKVDQLFTCRTKVQNERGGRGE